jgi:DNA repair protein RecO (recombination protein O)
LLPFQRLQVLLSRAPAEEASDIHALRSAELQGWQGGLPRSGAALFAGFYANELLLKLLARQDPHPLLFDHYAEALPLLAAGDAQPTLRALELALLRILGWLPELNGGADATYTLDPEMGLVKTAADSGITGEAWLRIEAALQHGEFAAIHQAASPVAARLRLPLRKLLHYHLNASKLRTREVLEGVQSLVSR